MKVVIVEDEALAAEKLSHLLKKVSPGVQILATIESVEEAIGWFSQNPAPDLVFMDIQLDDGISFEIFDTIKLEIPIVFTTAYNEYAIRAFKVNSVDYLLKPIEEEALSAAIVKFRKFNQQPGDFERRIAGVISQFKGKFKSRFFVKTGQRFQSIPVENISCFFVEERYTFLKTADGKTCDLDYSLDQLQKLVDPEIFFRVNRNYIVNINAIEDIFGYSTNRLKLKAAKEEIIVSRDKVSEFKLWMDR